jgi:alcohol dehydrogenase (cytochrome c)
MLCRFARLAVFSVCALVPAAVALAADFRPVTDEVLVTPDPADWLMINRTYDEQRYSPLDHINKSNVADLRMVWSRGMPPGTQESTPMVYNGVMYVIAPGGGVQALDATSGDLVWEYWRTYPKDLAQKNRAAAFSRGKNLAMFDDMVYFAAPDGFLIALDAQTGKVRWETKAHDYTDGTEHSGGLIVADGKVIRPCGRI